MWFPSKCLISWHIHPKRVLSLHHPTRPSQASAKLPTQGYRVSESYPGISVESAYPDFRDSSAGGQERKSIFQWLAGIRKDLLEVTEKQGIVESYVCALREFLKNIPAV